jgi:hypothetical protein
LIEQSADRSPMVSGFVLSGSVVPCLLNHQTGSSLPAYSPGLPTAKGLLVRNVLIATSVLLLAALDVGQSRADLVIDIGGTTITGTTGSVEVAIRSDQLFGDPLQNFNFQFFIIPASGTATQLAFLAPQNDSEFSDPAYVFATDSFKINFNAASPGSPLTMGNLSTTNFINDTFIGGDFTDSGNDVTVSPSGALLVTLDFTTSTAVSPSNGDQFLVTLGTDPDFNYFQDSNGNSIGFQSHSGLVTIGSVPEPSSLSLILIALGSGAIAHSWRARRSSRLSPGS